MAGGKRSFQYRPIQHSNRSRSLRSRALGSFSTSAMNLGAARRIPCSKTRAS